jgi:hypothetical protein
MVGAMPLTNADLTVVGVAAAVVLIAVVWALLSRRAVARRMGALTARMGESDLPRSPWPARPARRSR